jgi:hypothetical protein
MLGYICVRQSREPNHPELWYAFLQWDNNWIHPDFCQCGKGKEESLNALYDVLKDPKNLKRINKTYEDILKLSVLNIP